MKKAMLEARSAALLQGGEPLVLVTVVASAGSAPRHAGTRTLQTRGDSCSLGLSSKRLVLAGASMFFVFSSQERTCLV